MKGEVLEIPLRDLETYAFLWGLKKPVQAVCDGCGRKWPSNLSVTKTFICPNGCKSMEKVHMQPFGGEKGREITVLSLLKLGVILGGLGGPLEFYCNQCKQQWSGDINEPETWNCSLCKDPERVTVRSVNPKIAEEQFTYAKIGYARLAKEYSRLPQKTTGAFLGGIFSSKRSKHRGKR